MSNPATARWKKYLRTLPLRLVFAALVFALAVGYRYYSEHSFPWAGTSTAPEVTKAGTSNGLGDSYADDTARSIKLTDELNAGKKPQ